MGMIRAASYQRLRLLVVLKFVVSKCERIFLSKQLKKTKQTDICGSETGKLLAELVSRCCGNARRWLSPSEVFFFSFSSRTSVKLSTVVSRRSPSTQSFIFMKALHEDSWLIFPKLQKTGGRVLSALAAGVKSFARESR